MTDAAHAQEIGPYTLAPLPYDYAALEPVIDEATMKLHHDKHHQAYVDNLNKALNTHTEFLGLTIVDLLNKLDTLPADIKKAVRDNGGGHANHTFFWNILSPTKSEPTGELEAAIVADFGSVEDFKTKFQEAGVKQFGSGWVFLVAKGGKLEIASTPNQDSLLQDDGSTVILACDVWEHAYYLKYQNRRPEWLKAWWGVVNWAYAGERFAGAAK